MFTETQLFQIEFSAKKAKNQGEIAVFDNLLFSRLLEEDYNAEQWKIIQFCAEECKRQHSGEMSVYDMVVAWDYATKLKGNLDTSLIAVIGTLVEPIDNAKGFRKVPIGVSDGFTWIEKAKWERVPFLLEMLLSSYYEGLLEASNDKSENAEDEFYYQYEQIHPFFDGNGRSGKILYNYLKGTLSSPQMPPNFWGGSNP